MDDEPPQKQLEVLDLTIGKPPLPPSGPGPFEWVVAHWFEAWERAGRGKHSALTQAEGATLKRLVRQLGADELTARMDRALADPWFLERGDLMLFAKQRERFARAGRAAPVASATPALSPAGCREWARLRADLQERVRPETFAKFHAELVGRMEGAALVLAVPDRFKRDFLADNHAEFIGGRARALGIAGVRFEVDAGGVTVAAGGAA